MKSDPWKDERMRLRKEKKERLLQAWRDFFTAASLDPASALLVTFILLLPLLGVAWLLWRFFAQWLIWAVG